MTKIIVNADDLGLSEAVNYGIISAYKNGIVRSTTIMPGMPAFEHAIGLLKENKVDAQVEAVDLKSVDRYMDSSVAYIAITKIDKEYPIPVINGIAFLTGVGQDAELKKLIEACK